MKVQMQNYNNHCANTLVLKETGKNVSQGDGWNLKHPQPQNNSIIYYASRSICILFFNHLPRYVTSFNHYIKTGKCQILIRQKIYLISIRILIQKASCDLCIKSTCILHFDIFFWQFCLKGFYNSSHYCNRLHIVVYLVLRNIKCTVKINITKRIYVKGD